MNLCPLPLFRERFPVFNSKRFMSRAVARHGFRSFVTNPPRPYWFLCPRFSASHMFPSPPQLRAFPVSEDRLYGIVDVDYVLEGWQSVEDVLLVSREPCVQLATVSRLERAPYAVLADDPPRSGQCRKHRVVSQPVDVDVPRRSADDREHGRADDVADIEAKPRFHCLKRRFAPSNCRFRFNLPRRSRHASGP